MATCLECGNAISESSQYTYCLRCGTPIGQKRQSQPLRTTDVWRVTRDHIRSRAQRAMLISGAIAGVGGALTLWSYQSAAQGGTYVLFWGAILFGGYRFMKAMEMRDQADAL